MTKKRMLLTYIVVILFIIIGIGYAYLNQDLSLQNNVTLNSYTTGELDPCEFLMEDSAYSKSSGCSGGSCYYLLETPYVSLSSYVWSRSEHRHC